MMLWALKNWKYLVVVALTVALCYGAHSLRVSGIAAKHAVEMERQHKALTKACVETQQRAAEVSHEYQDQIARLNRSLADRKRLYRDACARIAVAAPAGRDAAAGRSVDAGQDGLSIGTLYDYAGEAEQYRLQLKACQQFVRKEWAAHGYSVPGVLR